MTDASKIARDRACQTTLTTVTSTMPTSMIPSASTSVIDTQDDAEAVADDAGSLLGLKSADTEKAGENLANPEASNQVDLLAPLLGTSYSQSIENARGSSKRRSPESVCYDKLLRESGPSSGQKFRKAVRVEGHDCYGKLLCAPHQSR